MRQALPASSKINTKFFYNPMQPSEAVQLVAVTEACSSKAKIFCRLCTCSNCIQGWLPGRQAGCASPKISRFFQAVSAQATCSCLVQKFCRLCTCNNFPSLHLRNCTWLPCHNYLLFSSFYLLHRHPIPPLI